MQQSQHLYCEKRNINVSPAKQKSRAAKCPVCYLGEQNSTAMLLFLTI